MFKRIAVSLAAAGLLTFAGLATAGAASAADNGQGTIYANNAFCGGAFVKTQPVQGFVNVHLDGTTLHLNVHLKDAKPDADYFLFQYGGFCSFENSLPVVHTNSNGVANLNTDVTVPAGTTTVFVFGETFTNGFADLESESVTP